MKHFILFSLAICFAPAFAGESIGTAPKSKVSTPIHQENANESLTLSEQENMNWNKRREERRLARTKMLSNIRNSNSIEKQQLQKTLEQNRNDNSRMEGQFPNNNERHSFKPEGGRPEPHREHFFNGSMSGPLKKGGERNH
jgi:hypothetical protein